MMNEKKYSILFILGENSFLYGMLPTICNGLIKMGHDVHVIYSSLQVDDEFETNLRKIPWIHTRKLPISGSINCSWAALPLSIRSYIKRHDGIDLIHSFGLNCGFIAYLASVGLKAVNINSPDVLSASNDDGGISKTASLRSFIMENITYVFNRLCDRILFVSEADRVNSLGRPGYHRLEADMVDFCTDAGELSGRLLPIYEANMKMKYEK